MCVSDDLDPLTRHTRYPLDEEMKKSTLQGRRLHMGLGGRLCTASEKKKNVAIILKAVITESERAAASGLGGAATLFAKEVKKK